MTDFILLTTLALCIVAMIGENSNPRGMNIFWYKVNVKPNNQIATKAADHHCK